MISLRLSDLASVVRSKNAGPFELTFDIIFADPAVYRRVLRSGQIDRAYFARLYHIDAGDVLNLVFFDPASAIKATIRRPVPAGGYGERDVYGAQQHAPLLEATIELEG